MNSKPVKTVYLTPIPNESLQFMIGRLVLERWLGPWIFFIQNPEKFSPRARKRWHFFGG